MNAIDKAAAIYEHEREIIDGLREISDAADRRELAEITNRAKVVVRGRWMSVTCRTPEDRERAFWLLLRRGREPVRFHATVVTCTLGG